MKKILVIGAGFLQDFVIRRAREMGYYTLAVDADPDAVGFRNADEYKVINIVDEEACLEYAREKKIDGVLTAATDFGVMTASYIAEKLGLKGLNYESARLIKNKYQVRKRLFENHVDDSSQAYEVTDFTDIDELSKYLPYPVMVKPCDGSGSRGTSCVEGPLNLKSACAFARAGSLSGRVEIERFIQGKEYGAESLVVDGEIHVLAIMKKWMTQPPYYAELGHAVPNDLDYNTEKRVISCVAKAIKALGINHGSVNMDMVITATGNIHIIDVGARMGGNMIGPCLVPYGTGYRYVENMIKAAAGDECDWSRTPKKYGTVATKLLAFAGGEIKRLPDFEAIEKEYNVEIYHHMKVGDMVNEYHTNLDGCGYIVARDASVVKAEETARLVLKKITDYIF